MYSPDGASVYHDFTLRDTSEVRDILREVRACDGPVLELAAGAGRLTVPLLSLRRDVTAVDLSSSMLALLRARLTALPRALVGRCTTVQADIADYAVAEQVGVAVLGTSSVSLLTDDHRRAMLRRTRDNLRPGGAFILTTAQISERTADLTERVFDVTGVSGTVHRVHDLVAADRCGRYTVVITPGDGTPRTVCHSFIRVVPPTELTADLAAAGFHVESTITLPGERYTSVLVRAVREG
ncbi:daptide-type RiPP biosynthesis methyltransferase [Streptomyces sp. NPDC058284]|uniref:daptide-type RiPP biosynthesis methyltransferase n=1 Tax=unclassified Streptomyces TaxID=2593676 RepID=UPI00364C3815